MVYIKIMHFLLLKEQTFFARIIFILSVYQCSMVKFILLIIYLRYHLNTHVINQFYY